MSVSRYHQAETFSVRGSGRGDTLCRGFGLSGLRNQMADELRNTNVVDTMT